MYVKSFIILALSGHEFTNNFTYEMPIRPQGPPTLRCHMPGGRPTIKMHRDADYARHYDTEINIWVPVTEVRESNGLYLESSPGKGDFRPFCMKNGQYMQFHGYACRHYSKENDTEVTRVSFDFRVIPLNLYKKKFNGLIGDYTTAVAYPCGQQGDCNALLLKRL